MCYFCKKDDKRFITKHSIQLKGLDQIYDPLNIMLYNSTTTSLSF